MSRSCGFRPRAFLPDFPYFFGITRCWRLLDDEKWFVQLCLLFYLTQLDVEGSHGGGSSLHDCSSTSWQVRELELEFHDVSMGETPNPNPPLIWRQPRDPGLKPETPADPETLSANIASQRSRVELSNSVTAYLSTVPI